MKRITIILCLAAFLLSACASLPAEPGSGATDTAAPSTQPSATDAPVASPTVREPLSPTEDPDMTEPPNLDDPVSSEDTPGAPQDAERSPLDPLPNEEAMTRGNVFLDEADVLVMESFPVQISLHLSGQLPTPCHNLRAKVTGPDDQNRIQVEVYTLVDPAVMCIQIIEDFSTSINLGSFPNGTYTVWVNGKQVGEFTS